MAIFRCKSCGGDLDVQEGLSVIECEYCGNKQTLPKVTDENLQALFNRANFLRQKCDFDKAEKLYEKILEQDEREAEAYWGIILCKFGIEYVKDPATENMVPTCHRASYDSIVADESYKQALRYADSVQRSVYEADAKKIDDIQKQILDISRKEKPYDVFICYKETDASGQRTHDSVMANDIYHQLTQEGFKVFYAAITLEGKLGSDYEAVIFAALNSAKVMLVVGSKPEYFQATWVRNEWSRYLHIMKKDRSRLLIPCYSGMDAYDLPEEFAHLQAQDMGKIGFINDLVRGIKKVIVKEQPKAAPAPAAAVPTSNVAPLVKRAFMFLEDGEFGRADDLLEQVLNQDPENAMAYVGKLMIGLQVRKMGALETLSAPFDNAPNYKKAIRFGDESLKETLEGYNDAIRNRNENAKREQVYIEADSLERNHRGDPENLIKASKLFASISGYKDASQRSMDCVELSKEVVYKNARELMKEDTPEGYWDAEELFGTIKGYKDADVLATRCGELALEVAYNGAVEEMNSANTARAYELAAKYFDDLENYKDSVAKAKECRKLAEKAKVEETYQDAVAKMDKAHSVETYDEPIKLFEALGDYKDSKERLGRCKDTRDKLLELDIKLDRAKNRKDLTIGFVTIGIIIAIIVGIIFGISRCGSEKRTAYKEAVALVEAGQWEQAVDKLEDLDFIYKDVGALLGKARYNLVIQYFDEGKITEAEALWVTLDEYHIVEGEERMKLTYHQAAAYANAEDYAKAKELYDSISDYSDVQNKMNELRQKVYEKMKALVAEKKYQDAYALITAFDLPEDMLSSDEKNIVYCLSLGDYADAVRYGLTDVEIPEGVTEITADMFAGCENLKSIKLPSTLIKIGDRAFSGCTGLTSITIPSGVTTIAAGAFIDCTALTEVILPSTLTVLADSVFENCTSLTTVTIPNSIIEIQKAAFRGCTSLVDIAIPAGVMSIGDYIFANCTSLKNVKFAENSKLDSIGAWAFDSCSNLTSITIPNSVTSIGDYAFSGCDNIETATIPTTAISYIPHSNLKTVVINGGTSIDEYEFYDCDSLTSVTISDSVTSIGFGAFENCSNLTNLTIPFVGATKNGTSDTYLGYIFGGSSYSYNYNHVPTSLNTVAITGGTSIGKYAFLDCDGLVKVTIGDSISNIDNRAFYTCDSLAVIEFAENSKLYSIGSYAFYNCSRLTSVTIPDSVTSIGSDAFAHCYSLTSVTIGNSVTSIGSYAFYRCYKLVEVINKSSLETTMTSYGLEVHNGASKIDNKDGYLFYTYNGVNYLVNYIGTDTELTLPANYNGENYVINAYAFYDNDSITSLTIPNSVTSIGSYAFDDCDGLTSVTIGNSVTSIGSDAFYSCSRLKRVTIGNSVTSIGSWAFADCTSLTSVTFANTSGWWYASSTATSGTSISSSSLANPSTAATYLKSTYNYYYWKRS